jgi:hypothetical protein
MEFEMGLCVGVDLLDISVKWKQEFASTFRDESIKLELVFGGF